MNHNRPLNPYLILLLCFFWQQFSIAQNIPVRYRKTVAFISYTSLLGDYHQVGTGFFMALKDSTPHIYLVTAKHVITDKTTKEVYPEIQILYNMRRSGRDSTMLELKTSGKDQNVFFHKDQTVDLAVVPIPLNVFLKEPDISFATEKELFQSKAQFDSSYISPGTNIFYSGMFSPYVGYGKNYPITRFGKVALITDEKIQFEKDENRASFILAETTTFGGNSGSPVFAYGSNYKITSYDTTDRINSVEQNHVSIYMLGIMKGYFQENNAVTFVHTDNMTPTYSNNIGVAAIIPSYFLYEILKSPAVTAFQTRFPLYYFKK